MTTSPPPPPPLLVVLTQQSLDQDYEVVAQRRHTIDAEHPHSHRRRRHIGALAVVALFGGLLAVAAVQTARNSDVASAGREQLISRIEERRATALDQRQRIDDLRRSNESAREAYRKLGVQLAGQKRIVETLGASTGWTAVRGDGLELVVRDSTSGSASGMVRDSDLALVVNGLWSEGATAIAVNGLRLTALSAFRNSAEVIRLNGTSLSPPYTVSAIGPASMEEKFRSSTSGSQFLALAGEVGLGVEIHPVAERSLPAAPASRLQLWYAKPVDRQPKSMMQEEQ